MSIKKICDCNSQNISIFSVVEKKTEVNKKEVPYVEITYVCNDCGAIDIEKAYLYK